MFRGSLATVSLLAFSRKPSRIMQPAVPSSCRQSVTQARGTGIHLNGPMEGFTVESSRCGTRIADDEDAVAALRTRR